MRLNRFNIKIIIYSLAIAFTGFMAYKSIFEEHLVVTKISWILVWMLLIQLLIRMLNRTNRRLNTFLSSLPYLDNINQQEDGDKVFKELNLTFNSILDSIKSTRKDKEAQDIYFRNTVEHVSIGLITFNSDGKIKMINRAALNILEIQHLNQLTDLNNLKQNFTENLFTLKPEDSIVFPVVINNNLKKIAFRKAKLTILDEELNILSLQDIKTQLEEEELEAWQKLIRILRHEIMNSVAPINSLSNSLLNISKKVAKDINPEQAEMLKEGLDAISNRSKGMMDFVEAYRNLTSIPEPDFTEFSIVDLLEELKNLYQPIINQRRLKLQINYKNDISILADYNLLSQVLINLIKNSLQAVEDLKGSIEILTGKNDNNQVYIKVIDNGTGIPEEELDKIFVPFYSTREEGTGIGLSLTRQILRIHKGSVNVESQIGKTVFTILL